MATHALHLRHARPDPWTARIAQAVCALARRRRTRIATVPAPPPADLHTTIYRLAPRV